MVAVSSWGRFSADEHRVVSIEDRFSASALIRESAPGLAFGMGRSYGDVCLNRDGNLWSTRGLDRFISLDRETGRLVCEAGVLLRDIQRLLIPSGWRLPVTPGTQMVTVGGAIANDVHGKNHHRHGTFGDHVKKIVLLRTDGEVMECGPDRELSWFRATVGGIGLTGLILTAEIQLLPVSGPWLSTETIPFTSLGEFFELSDNSEKDWEHTVSWIDCATREVGRGLFMRGNHIDASTGPSAPKLEKTVPLVPPVSLVNRLTLRAFNTVYYNIAKLKPSKTISHYVPFFYPLDNVHEWNRIYGPRGFFQYQCLIPRKDGESAMTQMLREISKSGNGSFLAVLKTFGNRESVGMLSFPGPGATLALDFPNKGVDTEKLFARLDSIVAETGGRLYLAKDARMPRALFESGYPQMNQFTGYRDPGIQSNMSRRLMGA